MPIAEEQHFHRIRRDLVDSRSTIDVMVLRPICDDCLSNFGVSPICFTENYDPVVMWPPNNGELERIYDRSSGYVIFCRTPQRRHVVGCSECHRPICTLATGSTIRVFEQDFTDQFGIEEPVNQGQGHRIRTRVRSRSVRERIRGLYGGCCFECKAPIPPGAPFELDHIHCVDRGGTNSFINLQLLCLEHGNKKGNSAVARFELALDMLLRPAPSDSFEGIW